jgi:hypothetical protein
MRRCLLFFLCCCVLLLTGFAASAQSDQNPALNAPDQVAWQLFIQANTRAAGPSSTFETWASDTSTFVTNPVFPAAPTPPSLRQPILPVLARQGAQAAGILLPAVPPGADQGVMEETRRNKAAFDFIVRNNLHKVSGLRAAFGKPLSFPVDAIEVKANWVAVDDIPTFTHNRVTVARVPQLYHVNTNAAGTVRYALVAMHVISKLVPNWTWATFEHKLNPRRCDILGCKDSFGAQMPSVLPNQNEDQGYPDCLKTPALTAMLNSANIDPVYANYCLKGSQADFVDNRGLDTRVGNSVTEAGFVASASCMTCHGRANFDRTGAATAPNGGFVGFDTVTAQQIGPLGPILPDWYFSGVGQPPVLGGQAGPTQTATSADFVWSIAICAIDDTQNPPGESGCRGR